MLLNGLDSKITAYDALTKKPVELTGKEDPLLKNPFGNGVAAAAYDRKHHRLYFTPMFVDQLRYIDLRSMKLYEVTGQAFTKLGHTHNDEAKIITRMAIAPDGYGYAISNDGKTFVRFSTGKKPSITQLGSLVDDPSNNGISIYNRCSSFGGDMIPDDQGNLVIISARNNVFTVNPDTRVAKFQGAIEGLPKTFTVNGAVVDQGGSLIVSSAVDGSSYFSVDPRTWKAVPYLNAPVIYKSSDLANSNFLSLDKKPATQIKTLTVPAARNSGIQVYPNPVVSGQFTLDFTRSTDGTYQLELTDVSGRRVLQRRLTITGEAPAQRISLPASFSKGVYLVKVIGRESQTVFEQKIMVQ